MKDHRPILLVNDDPNILAMMEELLIRRDLFYVTAATGKEALSKAKGYDFSLAVLDLELPDMAGDELYRSLMELESHYDLPVAIPLDTLDGSELQAFHRLVAEAPVTVISRLVLKKRLVTLFEQYGVKKRAL